MDKDFIIMCKIAILILCLIVFCVVLSLYLGKHAEQNLLQLTEEECL